MPTGSGKGLAALLATAALALCAPAFAQSTGGDNQNQQFKSAMDRVFGPGGWRETSGYRSQAREDELRREGAGTVPVGQISHHSMGNPDAPGAYDVVVPGMTTESAAARLKSSSDAFDRVIAERAHGGQGQHLHIEPRAGKLASSSAIAAAPQANPGDSIYLRVVNGRRNPQLGR
jgi:hypothetical protein